MSEPPPELTDTIGPFDLDASNGNPYVTIYVVSNGPGTWVDLDVERVELSSHTHLAMVRVFDPDEKL